MFIPYMGKNYVLDKLGSDAVNSLVLGMSYARLTKKYRGPCLQVMRASDFSSIWVEFSDGYIAISQIAAFCAGTEGRCNILYNQSLVAGANNAVQATWANMPIVFASGAFNADGLNFVSASSNFMSITDYAAVQLTEPPISIYINWKHSANGYILSKGSGTGHQITQGSFGTEMYAYWLDATNRILTRAGNPDTYIATWRDKNANGFMHKNSVNSGLSTIASALTNDANFLIGGRSGSSLFFGGNIKTICIWNSDRYPDYNTFVAGGM